MCLICDDQCQDQCSQPRFKAANSRAMCYGKTVAVFLIVHLVLCFARCLYYSFSAALSDLMLICLGFYIFRRFFRAEADPLPSQICLSCEAQQNLVCFMAFLAMDFGLSIWNLVELANSKPEIPQPVGLPQFDYRTLNLWQWKVGIVVSSMVIAIFVSSRLYSTLRFFSCFLHRFANREVFLTSSFWK